MLNIQAQLYGSSSSCAGLSLSELHELLLVGGSCLSGLVKPDREHTRYGLDNAGMQTPSAGRNAATCMEEGEGTAP